MYTFGYICGLATGLVSGFTLSILLLYKVWLSKGKGVHYVVDYIIWDNDAITREDGQAYVHHAKSKDIAKALVEEEISKTLTENQILTIENVEIMVDNVFYTTGR